MGQFSEVKYCCSFSCAGYRLSSSGLSTGKQVAKTQPIAEFFIKSLPRGLDKRVKQLFVLAFVNEIGRIPVAIYLPLFLFENYRASFIIIGLGLTISTGASAVSQMVGGVLADHFGRRGTMLLSLGTKVVILAILLGGSVAEMSVWALILLYAASEALSGVFQTASGTMIADVVSADRRVEAYGLYHIGVNFAFTLGALLGGFLTALRLLFMIWVVCTAISIFIVVSVQESKRPSPHRIGISSTLTVARNRFLLGFGLISLFAGLVANQMGATFTLYSTSILGISRSELGFLYFLNGVLVIFLQYPISKLVLRYRLSFLLASASMLRATGSLLIVAGGSSTVLLVVMTALTLGEMLQSPSAPSYAALLAPESERGEYLGFVNWSWNSGQALSPVIGGFLLALLSPAEYRIWLLVFVLGGICAISYVWLANKTRTANPRLQRIL